ncbi:MAG: hypothetical protein IJW47_03605 [Clostridia bacterium]|nr:hypothetical protein [Clostridia bacterium]
MKAFDFSLMEKSGNITLDILYALRKCKEDGYQKLVFPKAVYDIDTTFCEQRNLNISNHGFNGPKRIAILIDGMNNFEIDFNGSTLLTHGIITPVAIINSKNVKISNLNLDNDQTMTMQARVTQVNEKEIRVKIENGMEKFIFVDGRIYAPYGKESMYVRQNTIIEFNGKTGEIEHGTGDGVLGPANDLRYERVGEDGLIIRGAMRVPPVGNVLILTAYCRAGVGIFAGESEDLILENVKIHACYGMGMLVQFCKNVTVDGCGTQRTNGRYYTANADATHFVCCSGLVKMENCEFEGQYDDALNIHGVFLRVIDKISDDQLLIKQMHFQATGLPVLNKGDRVQALEPASLIPYAENIVSDVQVINDEIMCVKFKQSVKDINVGDDLENLDQSPDLIFRNNIVRDNRARGMLIAAKGKVVIENNRFHTAGAAILFESDGKWWFESGGTNDVIIQNNHFDCCKHGTWGAAVIQFVKREEVKKDRYYHGKVSVIGNKFDMYNEKAIIFDNIREVTFSDNKVNGKAIVDLSHCGKKELQKDGFIYDCKD